MNIFPLAYAHFPSLFANEERKAIGSYSAIHIGESYPHGLQRTQPFPWGYCKHLSPSPLRIKSESSESYVAAPWALSCSLSGVAISTHKHQACLSLSYSGIFELEISLVFLMLKTFPPPHTSELLFTFKALFFFFFFCSDHFFSFKPFKALLRILSHTKNSLWFEFLVVFLVISYISKDFSCD